METSQARIVDLKNKYETYDGLVSLFKSSIDKINGEVKRGGEAKSNIEHGDYGYFLLGDTKIVRFFARTSGNKVEAFCTTHFDKCHMGADVNKNPKQYFICGNLGE